MRRCIEALIAASDPASPWLVPAPRDVMQPLSKGALNQALRRMLRAPRGLGLEPFTPRDLRRTARSKLAALDTPNDVARKIMNHALEESIGFTIRMIMLCKCGLRWSGIQKRLSVLLKATATIISSSV